MNSKLLGIGFQAVDAHASVRERLRSERVDTKLGGVDRLTALADVVETFAKQTST